jgi:hypothetical protein
MAGDTFRDAFRAELAAVCNDKAVYWPIRDMVNASTSADLDAGDTGWIALEFLGGSEEQFTTGAPGANLFQENGQVTVRVYAPKAGDVTIRDQAEVYAEAIRVGFRARKFACGDRTVRIDSTAPMGSGEDDAGMWAEAIGLGYEIFNVG